MTLNAGRRKASVKGCLAPSSGSKSTNGSLPGATHSRGAAASKSNKGQVLCSQGKIGGGPRNGKSRWLKGPFSYSEGDGHHVQRCRARPSTTCARGRGSSRPRAATGPTAVPFPFPFPSSWTLRVAGWRTKVLPRACRLVGKASSGRPDLGAGYLPLR